MLERLYRELLSYPALAAALTGGLVEGPKPQDAAYPCLTFAAVSTVWAAQSHSGPGDLKWSRVSFAAWAKTPQAARGVIEHTVAALGTIDLTLPVASPAAVVTSNRHQFIVRMSDVWNDPEPAIYREILDVKIWFRE